MDVVGRIVFPLVNCSFSPFDSHSGYSRLPALGEEAGFSPCLPSREGLRCRAVPVLLPGEASPVFTETLGSQGRPQGWAV